MSHQFSGVALAVAAAALFVTGGVMAPVAQNECKGQNGCKGQGWVSKASAKECTDAGGKVAK